jgi:ribonuclease HI
MLLRYCGVVDAPAADLSYTSTRSSFSEEEEENDRSVSYSEEYSCSEGDEDSDCDAVGTWFYAVAVGKRTGIFTDYWGEVEGLTKGFPGALYKKFAYRDNAEHYLFLRGVYESLEDDTDWYYAVAIGRRAGIYTHFQDAKEETFRFPGFRMKKFERFWEAEAFLSKFGKSLMPGRCALQDDSGYRHWSARDKPWHAEDPKHPQSLVAFCDGSVLRNGCSDACAAIACVFPHRLGHNIVGPLIKSGAHTSNRAEFMAAVMALEFANEQDPAQDKTLFVFTSSLSLVMTMREWIHAWIRNGWVTIAGTPVKNQDVIQQLRDLQGSRPIHWRHVIAHQGEITTWEAHWNNVADSLANQSARVNDELQRKVARIV